MSKKFWLGLVIGVLLLGGALYSTDLVQNQGKIPRATAVGGVDISGMERDAAVEKLQDELGDVENQPVTITAGEKSTEINPRKAGLTLDFQAAVDSIEDESYNPLTRVFSFIRPTREVAVSPTVDENTLSPVLAKVTKALQFKPEDGEISLKGGEVNVKEPKDGQNVDREELKTAVVEQWLNPDGVQVKPEKVTPAIDQDDVDKLADGDAKKAVSKPLTLVGEDDVEAVIEPADIAKFVFIDRENDSLHLRTDSAKAQEIFAPMLAETETPMQNARISFSGGKKQVTPHKDGSTIDWDATMKGFEKRVTGDADRKWDAVYTEEKAEFTTADAKKASFDDVIGEFTTSGYSDASGTNIRIVADAVNGAMIAPGEVFSLNGYTGPRGIEQGYVESGIILDGHADTAVGGGISQFATTLYNAAYFAGMGDTAHTPHSYYISRYPAGREATVYEGAIDLQFENTSKYPVMIETAFGGGDITVRLKGVKQIDVESINNGRWAPTEPHKITLSGDDCVPSSGAPGFTTSDTRVIRDLKGKEISRETVTTVYDPQPNVSCEK